jgi:hypothetical protein
MLGNVISSLAIATLSVWRVVFGTDAYSYTYRIQRYRPEIELLTLGVCAAVFVIAFLLARRMTVATAARGFDGLPLW